eukprot:jgi/Psemu1/263316/estExt_Genewise1Plus.C_9950006
MLALVLVQQISSFPLLSLERRLGSQPRTFLTSQRSTSVDTDTDADANANVEEAIRLGRSEFEKYFDFPLDDWQLQAGGSILLGHNVIVCAPTGSGKTVVGEMALHSAFDRNLDGIYTTPLKALSNQKFSELRQTFGNVNVGLSTGDISINREAARLTVMTTEVYRNIAWRSSGVGTDEDDETPKVQIQTTESPDSNDLRKNSVVVLDEFHYMGQPGRGGVWEECVITSPAHTQIIGLSATLANAKELADWMTTVTGRHTELIEAPGARPVPLKYLFATREGLFPLFRNPDAGPGSPLGLLGYRGDGIPSSTANAIKNQKEGLVDGGNDGFPSVDKLPKGLKVNPALSGLAQRRVQKVNRMIERQKDNQRNKRDNFDESDWFQNKGKGRGRGRGRNSFQSTSFSSREGRKERERLTRKEMRKAVPSLTILLTRLKEKNLLPAIFFIFSRAGCDQAAETICNAYKGPRDPNFDLDLDDDFQKPRRKERYGKNKNDAFQKKSKGARRKDTNGDSILEDNQGRSFRLSSNNIDENAFNSVLDANSVFSEEYFSTSGSPLSSENWKFYASAGLLTYDEVQEVAKRVAQFNEENPEIALSDSVVEQLLFGLGCHHAGMLPAHKMLIETLFRLNMMKAVFATEVPKRSGGGSMAVLETSNLLQMAGRAGRRGMDTTGTCVLVATPFEGEDVAATILTDPIKPISSQFRPSYSLAVNLIARGNGKLDVAKQLVSRSFANWGRQQMEEARNGSSEASEIADLLTQVSEEKFMKTLIRIFDRLVERRSAKFDIAFLSHLTELLKDRELLKKSSKSFDAAKLAFELETTTLGCLEMELKDSVGDETSLFEEDEILEQVEEQRGRVQKAEKNLKRHPFTSIVKISNDILSDVSAESEELSEALQTVEGMGNSATLDPEDLARFAKSAIMVKQKLKKLARSNPDMDPEMLLLLESQSSIDELEDSAWKEMLAITKVMIAFGCIIPASGAKKDYSDTDLENETFEVTPAGTDVGMLSFENSLWCFLAVGGTFDVTNASAKFDKMKESMDIFDYEDEDEDEELLLDTTSQERVEIDSTVPSKSQQEAETLLYHLRELSPGEMAGYVSCLVTGDTARGGRVDSISVFKRLGPRMQRSIQVLLDGTERFIDVQRQYFLDEKMCSCQFDLSHVEVVTAWANGCTWSEALEISGAAPGDLTRIIGRATDAVRQLGALKFNPIRKNDLMNPAAGGAVDPFARGIHPDVRRLCREAVAQMNRYPVKDPLPFGAEEDAAFSDDDEADGGEADDGEADDGDVDDSNDNNDGTSDDAETDVNGETN